MPGCDGRVFYTSGAGGAEGSGDFCGGAVVEEKKITGVSGVHRGRNGQYRGVQVEGRREIQ